MQTINPIIVYEVFKPITTIPGVNSSRYMISNFGKIRGEDTPLSVITNEQAEVAGIVSPDASSLISSIRRGVVWRHISRKYNFSKNYKGEPYKVLK